MAEHPALAALADGLDASPTTVPTKIMAKTAIIRTPKLIPRRWRSAVVGFRRRAALSHDPIASRRSRKWPLIAPARCTAHPAWPAPQRPPAG